MNKIKVRTKTKIILISIVMVLLFSTAITLAVTSNSNSVSGWGVGDNPHSPNNGEHQAIARQAWASVIDFSNIFSDAGDREAFAIGSAWPDTYRLIAGWSMYILTAMICG